MGARKLVAIALTWAGGYVDAFAYLMLGQIYVATMSGNTVSFGVHAIDGDTHALVLHVLALGAFVLGLVIGGLIIRVLMQAGLRHVLAIAMALEAVCLATVLLVGIDSLRPGGPGLDQTDAAYALAPIAAVAMGIQNTSLRMAKVLTVYTTHVTGSLTKFSEDAIDWLLPLLRTPSKEQRQRTRARDVLFSFSLWLGFFLGALAAAYAIGRIGMPALVVPIGIVVAVAAIDCVAPLGRAER